MATSERSQLAGDFSSPLGVRLSLSTADRPRHVVFIINSLAGGGAERVMCTLLRASAEELRDCRISLLLLDREPAAYEVPPGVELTQLDCRHSLLRSVWSVWRALRRAKPDVTVSFLTRANIASIIATSVLKIPAIVSERVNTSSHLGRGLGALLARGMVRLTYPRARRVIAVSQGVAEELRTWFGVAADRLAVIANPVDLDEIRARAERGAPVAVAAPYIVAMGRLVPNKNFSMLIDAFARSGTPGTLLILGEGPERAALTQQVRSLGLQDRVVMPGFAADPFPTLRHAAAFVSSSNAEGFPNALLEAMTVGLPVISTNCPSGPSEVLADLPRERVEHGVCFAQHGILVPPEDSAAMAAALRALEDPEHRRHYAEAAPRRAAEFGVVRAKDAYWAVIRSQLSAGA